MINIYVEKDAKYAKKKTCKIDNIKLNKMENCKETRLPGFS